jgi:aspartyl-tRNA(Asn)/glutamyl-tRNA(Gln) amidotransferase subunit C
MSQVPELNIDDVAHLARIALTDGEKAAFARQLGDVLGYIAKLREVDVSNVEPTAHAFPVTNVWEEDVARPGLPVAALNRMAPAARLDQVVVPKVVEEA